MNVEIENTLNPLSWLIQQQNEPLFLKPDGVRTRYCIGWNGYGRYLPGTLKVTYNGLPCNISEESNGIFFNFDIAPSGNYNDYTVSYAVRPLDYAFSTGNELGGYKGEEYFLFPNWNNALGEGDAFWIGKWQASNRSSMPQSKAGMSPWTNISRDSAINACKNKGNGFNIMRNRQWVSIALWTSHHEIHVKGYIRDDNSDLDGDGTPLSKLGGTVTGPIIPDTWNHNGRSNGIHHMVGYVWEIMDGLENRSGEIYIYDENGNYIDSGVSVRDSSGDNIVDITNTSQAILNEGIANTVTTNGYIPSNLDEDYAWYHNGITAMLCRGGTYTYGVKSGLWTFDIDNSISYSSGIYGFRLSKELI